MKLLGKTVVISGGASGLGLGTAHYCVREKGMRVAVLDMNAEAGQALVRELGEAHAMFLRTDVGDERAVAQAVEQIKLRFGGIHACFNFAGVVAPMRILDRQGRASSGAVFRDTVLINLVGTFNVASHCAAAMSLNEPDADAERGVIVNIASGAAFDGQVGQSAYASSKAGVVGLSLPAARELSAVGIRVNAIAPGAFHTPMLKSLPDTVIKRIESDFQFPKRFGHADEIAGLCSYICENGYINGECIRLDGAFRLPPR